MFTAIVNREVEDGGFSAIIHPGEGKNAGVIITEGDDWDELISRLHEALSIDYPDPSVIL